MKSTYKRRSSVFLHVPRNIEDSLNDEDEERKSRSDKTDDKDFDLPVYINKLRNERKAWKETLRMRKSKRRNLQKQKTNLQRREVDLDINILSETERSFLLARPSYERICKNIKTLADAAAKIVTLNRQIDNLNDKLALKVEEKLQDATRNLIKMSNAET